MSARVRWGLSFLLALSIVPALAMPATDGQPHDAQAHGPQAHDATARGMLAEPVTAIPRPEADGPRAQLGARLFASRLMSRDGSRSCATCHDVDANGAEATRVGTSPSGQPLRRNTPTVFNSALSFRQGWEGEFRTLQDESAMAIGNAGFLNETWDHLLPKLRGDRDLNARFLRAFGRQADERAVLDALAAYQRTLLTPDSRFDQWLGGDANALKPHELAGYALFKSIGCVSCHQGVNFGGNLYEKAGIFKPLLDHSPIRMRVPSLRNVAVTAPYFDDGSAATLRDAVRRMAEAQLGRQLSDAQIDSIAAFLETLTGRYHGRLLQAAKR